MRRTTSVVVPAHNAERTVAQAIESALRQSLQPDEIVVVCDSCTDATAEIARACGAKVIEAQVLNGSAARNIGVGRSFGEVLFFLDADDWWDETKIERHMIVWQTRRPSFVIDRSRPILPNGERAHWTGGVDEARDAAWEEFLSYRSWASGSSFSVTREVCVRIDGFREVLNKFQDVDFWIRAAQAFGPAACLGEELTNYRLSYGPTVSKTVENIEENLDKLFEGWQFATEGQKESFCRHAYLTAAEVTPWPRSVAYFSKAHWPVTKRFFWKSLYQSLKRSA